MNKQLTFQEKYNAIGSANASEFEGMFITAVKTTGIFCRPTCRARKPKAENVEFYASPQIALSHGFRPCKLCQPTQAVLATPTYITDLISELHAQPDQRIKDSDLLQRQLTPSKVRRWFNKHYGMTFQAYQRMLKVNHALQHMQQGNTVTASAYHSGYESLSGFNDGYKAIFGQSATRTGDKMVIHTTRFNTPIGTMVACATEQGLCLLEFADRQNLDATLANLCQQRHGVILPGDNPHLQQTHSELNEYFVGDRRQFSVALDILGTPFQRAVWAGLQTIAYGTTCTYKQQAIALDKPKAFRAVASANGNNRIAIVIPCHRVVGSDGRLSGFRWGLTRKQWLLDLERNHDKS